ncbi:Nucleobindin-2 [Toxocara canis]|uniref:Nucleobindin-2 n=1 Tax=Toxocara canis TaxID=6265 RepID=A0A0B2UUP0_TOXCA|nr:Nucleobindin-2 [Toxocara canis]
MGVCREVWLFFVIVTASILVSCAPPKREPPEQQQEKVEGKPEPGRQPPDQQQLYHFAYSKYLEQVVKVLESDPKFTERLKNMPEGDIKSGKIADHIEELSSHTFEQLTKLKLAEIERLREVIAKQIEADGGAHNIKVPEHIDVNDWEKFGKEDLRKLIVKTVADMEKIDEQRREQFKEYEMQKKAEADHKMANMTPEERKKFEQDLEQMKKRHNEHEKVKHPGSRDQLEEVWEDSDKMEKENFDPRTFFALHDLNGDGFWSAEELEALFQLELQKVYNESDPDDDPRERIEEMYRMREHVVQQMDKNNDRMISLAEFLADAEAQTPNKDDGWKDIGDEAVYSDDELKKFEEEYAKQQGWGEYAYSTPATTVAHRDAQQRRPAVGEQQAAAVAPVQHQMQDIRVDVGSQQQQRPAAQAAHSAQSQVPAGGEAASERQQRLAPQGNTLDKTYGV